MDFMNFIIERALILVPALYILGKVLKTLMIIPDKFIPSILMGFGISGAVWMMGFSPESVIQGVLVTGASVFTNQLFKQAKKKTVPNDGKEEANS